MMYLQRSFTLFIYFTAIASPAVLAFCLQPTSEVGFIAEAGMLLGMSGIMMVFFQFVISARIKWLDRLFGYNNLLNFHRRMGIWAFCFILIHLLLVTLAEQTWKMLISIDIPWYVNLGKVTFLILCIQIITSIWHKKIRLTYEKWRVIHDFFAVTILVMMFLHSFYAGGDLELLPLQIIWFGLPIIGISLFMWQRYFLFAFAPVYTITDIIKKTENVHTISFEPNNNNQPLAHNPGQFHFIKFTHCTHLKSEEHPFTISSSPSQKKQLASTIKSSGDFTNQISRLKKGDKVKIIGPYGKMSFVEKKHEGPIVFIAAGIGITPFMSMLQYMADTNHSREVTLLYFNKTESDIVFRKELDDLMSSQTKPDLKVVHILSQQKQWEGEKGHFHKNLIEKYCPKPFNQNHYYICGPSVMSHSALKELQALNIPLKNIHSEMFGLAESKTPATHQKKQSQWLAYSLILLLITVTIFMAGTRSNWKMYESKTHVEH